MKRKMIWKRVIAAALVVLMVVPLLACSHSETNEGATNPTQSEETPMPIRFSFQYDRKNSSEFIDSWIQEETSQAMEGYTLYVNSYLDPDTGLKITVETKQYQKQKAIEWVARLENTGTENTPIIEKLDIANISLDDLGDPSQPLTISYSKGSNAVGDDFSLKEEQLARFGKLKFTANGGRSSSRDYMPYFNLQGEGKGYVCAVGWTGQWQVNFEREASGAVRVMAGMETTHFVLYPGESVRTPSFAVLEWEGKAEDSYNVWRSFMLDHHTPKNADGSVVTLPITCGTWGGKNEAFHLDRIATLSNAGADYDAYWVDAGWFGSADRISENSQDDDWIRNVGDWFHNTTLYPNGLSPVSSAAKEAGYDFLLWFEPERAWWDSLLVQEHPDWFMIVQEKDTSYLFNMANEEARQWMTDFISNKIQEYGVSIYRQDFNTDVLPYWEAYDTKDRQGITEMKYIEGLYTYLDELLARNPGLILDNCAGGGRRLDYEMLTRALPFWRSDYQCFATAETTPCQVQTDGLSRWVPLSGTGVANRPLDTYSFRSNLAYAVQYPMDATNREWHSKMIAEFHQAQPYFLGDYYCLTDGDIQSNSEWYAYQMHREDLAEGFILAFRREQAEQVTITLPMYLPEGSVKVQFTDADTRQTWTETLKVTENGRGELILKIDNPRDSKLIFYKILQ